MTKEEKMRWLAEADTEALLRHYESCYGRMTYGSIEERIEALEDYNLAKNELFFRLNKDKTEAFINELLD